MSISSAEMDYLSINLYYFLINEKKMCEKLSSKITGMLIEDIETLIEFKNHNYSFLNQQINEALNVLLEYKCIKNDSNDLDILKSNLFYEELKLYINEYKITYGNLISNN